MHQSLTIVLLAVLVAVLITRIQRRYTCASRIFAAGRVKTPRVAVAVSMLAASGALKTAQAAASETYEQNRTQANDTMKHCGQSDDLTSRHECQRIFGAVTTYPFHRHFRMLSFNDCAKFFDNADFNGVSSIWSQPWLRLKSGHSTSESSFRPPDDKIQYDSYAPISRKRCATD